MNGMSGQDTTTVEIIKYLMGVIVLIGGSYVVVVVQSLRKEISSVKELLLGNMKSVNETFNHHRADLSDLYNLHRENERRIIEVFAGHEALRKEHERELERCHRQQNVKK